MTMRAKRMYRAHVFPDSLSGSRIPRSSQGAAAKIPAAQSYSMPTANAPSRAGPKPSSACAVMVRAMRAARENAKKRPNERMAKRAGMDERKRFIGIVGWVQLIRFGFARMRFRSRI